MSPGHSFRAKKQECESLSLVVNHCGNTVIQQDGSTSGCFRFDQLSYTAYAGDLCGLPRKEATANHSLPWVIKESTIE